MDQESIVYGCIKDSGSYFDLERRKANRQAVLALPKADTWPFLCQEMFTVSTVAPRFEGYHTEVVHFGASYKAVEYEWAQWIQKFEQLLNKMYWDSAVVHLETELSGTHSFFWEANEDFHVPFGEHAGVRCEWVREQGILS